MSEKFSNKSIVLGMKERAGRIETRVIPDTKTATLRPIVLESVKKGATVSTDETGAYNLLKGDGYIYGAVRSFAQGMGLD